MAEIIANLSKYWDIYRTLTYNALFNFILSIRGNGKSYGVKKRCIENFIKKKEQFGYVRRYKDDLKQPMEEFFKDVGKEFPDHEWKVEGTKFYIRTKAADPKQKWTNDDIAGYGFHLSTANNKKSISYPFITTIMFDEFLLEEGNQRYLPNEVRAFLNLYETIARPGTDHPRVVVWFLANAITITNPYFLYFGLKLPIKTDKNGKRIWRHPEKSIIVEDATTEAFVRAKTETEFGAMIADTDYGNYSINNKFLLDDDTFIEKRSQLARNVFNFIYNSYSFGVWYDHAEGLMWVSNATDPYAKTYSFTVKDHTPNTMLLKARTKPYFFRMFLDAFKQGTVRFETVNIKNMCYDILKMTMT